MGTGCSIAGLKRPGREANHSHPSNAEVKNAWSYTSTPKYSFMARCSVKLNLYLLVQLLKFFFPLFQNSHTQNLFKTWMLPQLVFLFVNESTEFSLPSWQSDTVLRRIFRPKREEDGLWRKLHDDEFHSLYSSPNIKSRRMR